jgi:hypothetical protein
MDNSLELVGAHDALLLGPLDLVLVYVLEDTDDDVMISTLKTAEGQEKKKKKELCGWLTYRLQAM